MRKRVREVQNEQEKAWLLHVLHKHEKHANESARDVEEELRGVLVRKDAVKPGKIIDEIHNGDLRFNTEKNDKGTHLHSPDSD